MLVDDLGYIAGSGAILNSQVILTAAQNFEGYDIVTLILYLSLSVFVYFFHFGNFSQILWT